MMSNETYDEKAFTDYLLGALPEDKTLRFDELCFTDVDFAALMEAALMEAAEHDLVDAYVHGELSGERLERFKRFYLASPVRRWRVDFAAAFSEFAETEPSTAAVAVDVERQAGYRSGFGKWLPSWFSYPRLQLGLTAAVLVLLIGAGWLLFQNYRLRQQIYQAQQEQTRLQMREQELQAQLSQSAGTAEIERELEQVRAELTSLKQAQDQGSVKKPSPSSGAISIAYLVLTPPFRGTPALVSLDVTSGTEYVDAQLVLEADDFSTYGVNLRTPAYQILWRRGRLKVKTRDDANLLSVRVPARLLNTQTYIFQVSGTTANGYTEIVGNYPFRVLRK